MFEDITQSKQREGLRGFISRHFGPVVDEDLARQGIRDVGMLLLILAGLNAILGWLAVGPVALVVTMIIGVPALVLRMTPSRAAALFLLFLTGMIALLAFPKILPWLWVLFSLRSVQLTFGYHRLRKAKVQQPASTFPVEP